MNYPLPKKVRALQAKVRRFVDGELRPFELEAEANHGDIPKAALARQQQLARRLGIFSMNMPKKLGGGGLSTLEQVIVSEQLGRVTNALGWVVSQPARFLAEIATPYQMKTWVKPAIQGTRNECWAITEEGAGSDVDAIKARARRVGDAYVLNGEKWHVTSANKADHIIFQAKLTSGRHKGEHALFFVDMDTPGVRMVRSPAYTHTYSSHHPIYRFRNVRVPLANRIGAEGGGMDYTQDWFRYERLMIAARCCGAAERLIEEASTFTKRRRVYGRPIADYQAIQFMLADSLTELWAARLMLYRTAEGHDAGEDVKVLHGQCSMAKLYASEMAGRVADRAVQIFGGRGYMRENVAERFYREVRVDRIWEGTSEIQRLIIARNLFKRGQAPLIG